MVATPRLLAIAMPSVTVATLESLDVQVIVAPTSAVPWRSVTVAAKWTVSPIDAAVSVRGARPIQTAPNVPTVRRVVDPSRPTVCTYPRTVANAARPVAILAPRLNT